MTYMRVPYEGFPWWLRQERIRLQSGRPGVDPWVGKIPWRRKRLPTLILSKSNEMNCVNMLYGVEQIWRRVKKT